MKKLLIITSLILTACSSAIEETMPHPKVFDYTITNYHPFCHKQALIDACAKLEPKKVKIAAYTNGGECSFYTNTETYLCNNAEGIYTFLGEWIPKNAYEVADSIFNASGPRLYFRDTFNVTGESFRFAIKGEYRCIALLVPAFYAKEMRLYIKNKMSGELKCHTYSDGYDVYFLWSNRDDGFKDILIQFIDENGHKMGIFNLTNKDNGYLACAISLNQQ